MRISDWSSDVCSSDLSDRCSSHRLRFDVRRPGEDDLDAISRINQYASEEDIEDIADAETFGLATTVGDPGWRLGDRKRRRDTIHHDCPSSEHLAQLAA